MTIDYIATWSPPGSRQHEIDQFTKKTVGSVPLGTYEILNTFKALETVINELARVIIEQDKIIFAHNLKSIRVQPATFDLLTTG